METRRHIVCLCPGVSGRHACHGRYGLAWRPLRCAEAHDRGIPLDIHGHGSPGNHKGTLAVLRFLRAICRIFRECCFYCVAAGHRDPMVQPAYGHGVRHLLGRPGSGANDFCSAVPLAHRNAWLGTVIHPHWNCPRLYFFGFFRIDTKQSP
jgi:hypothetical protein